MLAMLDLGLLNGDYVAVALEIMPDTCKENDGRDEEACNAFEGLLDISLNVPDSEDFEAFKTTVYNRMPEMNITMNSPDEVSNGLKCELKSPKPEIKLKRYLKYTCSSVRTSSKEKLFTVLCRLRLHNVACLSKLIFTRH